MTILVAIADDAARDRVLDTATELGTGLDRDLYIVHLVEQQTANPKARRIREEIRERTSDAAVVSTISVEYITHQGSRSATRTARELLDIAADVDITHIVMGHLSKGVVENITQGNTAFAVVDESTVPVTIVPVGGE
ncbi:universal stress protein [Halomicroarcula sp. GCM10025709]|uniref:universal stress protein n=1 Tax=Haloarcula TaxID=2237 RepID=UPI0024C3B375|nr:universal stress protein [Halomicroarcula sp. YJ-61-S]